MEASRPNLRGPREGKRAPRESDGSRGGGSVTCHSQSIRVLLFCGLRSTISTDLSHRDPSPDLVRQSTERKEGLRVGRDTRSYTILGPDSLLEVGCEYIPSTCTTSSVSSRARRDEDSVEVPHENGLHRRKPSPSTTLLGTCPSSLGLKNDD